MNLINFLGEDTIQEIIISYPNFDSFLNNFILELSENNNLDLTINNYSDMTPEFLEIIKSHIFNKYKIIKLNNVKLLAYQKLQETDWKVIRQRDQVDAGIEPDMTETEYLALLNERESIRDQSDIFEQQINAVVTKEELDFINIQF